MPSSSHTLTRRSTQSAKVAGRRRGSVPFDKLRKRGSAFTASKRSSVFPSAKLASRRRMRRRSRTDLKFPQQAQSGLDAPLFVGIPRRAELVQSKKRTQAVERPILQLHLEHGQKGAGHGCSRTGFPRDRRSEFRRQRESPESRLLPGRRREPRSRSRRALHRQAGVF